MDILRRVDVFRRDRNPHSHKAPRSRNELLPTNTDLSVGTSSADKWEYDLKLSKRSGMISIYSQREEKRANEAKRGDKSESRDSLHREIDKGRVPDLDSQAMTVSARSSTADRRRTMMWIDAQSGGVASARRRHALQIWHRTSGASLELMVAFWGPDEQETKIARMISSGNLRAGDSSEIWESMKLVSSSRLRISSLRNFWTRTISWERAAASC
jgi:hypothetical protein